MNFFNELDLLDEEQKAVEQMAEQMEFKSDVDRRSFVFMSLAAAAATTFGFGSSVLAQGRAGAAGDSTAASGRGGGRGQGGGGPQTPLDGMENIAWTFMAYPGGNGALFDKTLREKGAAAFERQQFAWSNKKGAFYIEPWKGNLPATDEEIAFLPAHRLSAAIKAGKLTSTRLTKIYLDRLKKYQPQLLWAVTILEEKGLAYAAQMDQELRAGKYRGPLHGLPWGIKDLFAVKGTPTTWGAKDFADRIIDVDSEVYVRLRDAGAVLIAKLATGQFAQGDGWWDGERQTRNPWNGGGASGSSAGPGSATAGAGVAFGIGTETSGSIVSPASANGISALRPTFGRVSRHGGMVLGWSQDRVGPMTRTQMDAAMVFNVIHGSDEKDPGTITMPFHFNHDIDLSSLRIGNRAGANANADMAAFIGRLKDLGAKMHDMAAPPPEPGGSFNPESAAAFDYYVQAKARQYNIALADLVAMYANAGGRGGGGRGGGGAADSTAGRGGGAADSTAGRGGGAPAVTGRAGGGGSGLPGSRDGQLNRWIGGRSMTAMDFINNERRRLIATTAWQAYMKDTDLYVGAQTGAPRTGYPVSVVQIGFGTGGGGGRGGGGRGRGAAGDSTAAAGAAGAASAAAAAGAGGAGRGGANGNPRPITTHITGNLFNDDLILSVGHKYQINTKWHLERPKMG
jgi:Asp-tRNA(Asn)/Glu-tRNA(Gln) amidotransferase A subunit family amidase